MPHKRTKRSEREKTRLRSGNDLDPGAKKVIENEAIPKSVSRVLNAAKVQREWAEKKKKRKALEADSPVARKRWRKGGDELDGGGSGPAGRNVQLRIMHGESMTHFNRRVEDSMRHSVREAIQASSATMRQARREELATKQGKNLHSPAAAAAAAASAPSGSRQDPISTDSHPDKKGTLQKGEKDRTSPKEFEKLSTSAPKRLNDIVQAPPELKKLPRKAKKLLTQGDLQKTQGAKSLREGVLSMAQKASLEEERERAIRLYREMKRGRASS